MKQTTQEAYYMQADQRSSIKEPLELSSLVGNWVNTKPETDYFVRVVMSEQNGRLMFQGYGANEPDPIDWGEVEAQPYAVGSSLIAGGLHAFYNLDGIETHLVANQKLGILVIQSYTRYVDGSGRASHFAREFFHR